MCSEAEISQSPLIVDCVPQYEMCCLTRNVVLRSVGIEAASGAAQFSDKNFSGVGGMTGQVFSKVILVVTFAACTAGPYAAQAQAVSSAASSSASAANPPTDQSASGSYETDEIIVTA